MNVYKNLIILIILSILIVISIYEGTKRVTFKPFLFSKEQEIADFFHEKHRIIQRERNITAGLRMPLDSTPGQKKDFPDISLSEALNENTIETKSVSMILIKDGQKIAIVNNQVVREGDLIGKEKVLKIASDKILISEGRINKWFTIEQAGSRVSQKKDGTEKTLSMEKKKPSVFDK